MVGNKLVETEWLGKCVWLRSLPSNAVIVRERLLHNNKSTLIRAFKVPKARTVLKSTSCKSRLGMLRALIVARTTTTASFTFFCFSAHNSAICLLVSIAFPVVSHSVSLLLVFFSASFQLFLRLHTSLAASPRAAKLPRGSSTLPNTLPTSPLIPVCSDLFHVCGSWSVYCGVCGRAWRAWRVRC